MTKYKLLQDLPFAKAGEVFERHTFKSKDGLSDYDYFEIRKLEQGETNETAFGIKRNYFIDNFDEWFEEIKQPTSSIHWKPKYGERYYYITGYGDIDYCSWGDYNLDVDRYDLGNVYHTKEECQKAIDRQKAIATLRRNSTFEPDWDDPEQERWTVYYNHDDKELFAYCTAFIQYGVTAYFGTCSDAEASIKNHEKEWLLFFGIEE